MKKFLVLGSLAAVLLVTGCSQKSSVDSSANANANQGKGYVSGQDNFATIEERIGYVEGRLQNVFFDFDKFVVRTDMQSVVDSDASILTSPAMGPLTVRIEGNTDEWGTDEYNYALGLKRAVAVKSALVAKGVAEERTVLVSYGESKPTCTTKTKECWAENRKVTFKMLP
ncbi:OmpA family protein [Helicobacter turcicus]|uniref:Peptidoglycan-associated lipoprotein n=1 Tax=Helicobacter turcicus TaxID=2867412 RepID=A0ABS7JKY8_9HELI|nr:OmpA family protein [Helicobacter turcicus]MBX7490065.1 OmpA family protein [Helicobacter turcicus]MBX7544924.1 OmpA family protein [Helicobacter turcicus]